ncbi:MAG: AMP-binding protein [Acidimicrobiales bacterium]
MPGWTYADVWETVATTIPEAQALVDGYTRRTWAEFNDRANAVASYLLDAGCGHDSKVAFYLHNRNEYLELFFACSKAGFVHVNTNYRYTDDELFYIWDNADCEAVLFEGTFAATTNNIRHRLPGVKVWLWLDDNTGPCPEWAVPFETAAATPTEGNVAGPTARDGDDLLLIYTGGTTGMPKGVMWRQDDLLMATDKSNRISLPATPDLDQAGQSAAVRARTPKPGPISIPACPLMHGTGLFNSLNTLNLGGSIVSLPGTKFEVETFLDVIDVEKVKSTFIVGDAFAKPILRALDAEPDRWSLESLRVIISSGVMWGSDTKQGLLRHNPNLILVDTFGSSEAIGLGSSMASKESSAATATFTLSDSAVVISDDGTLVEPGSGVIGKVGIAGRTPVGYFKDPAKTAETFPRFNGIRYSIPGDFATVEADGTITLLGRGSVCINTGGEKVFPEEVEEALKQHPSVHDASAVGIPDERFGQAVSSVVELEPGADLDERSVIDHVKKHLAGYKAPKTVFAVSSLDRAANGKIDYKRWTAHAEANAQSSSRGPT